MPDPTPRSIELNQKQINSEPIISPEVAQTGLGTLLGGEGEITFSNAGANGAILVKSKDASSGGAAIKLEGSLVGQRVEKVAKLMDDFFRNANGPSPFVTPRVSKVTSTDLEKNPGTVETISQLLEERRINDNANRVDRFQKKLNEVPLGESDIMVMELARGKQLNSLSTDDKIALYKSEEFAKTLGRSVPVMMALRLNDHLGSGDEMCFKNNVSNLMFDVDAGKLSVIDFDTGMQQSREHDKLLRIGPPPSGFKPAVMVGELNEFLTEACSSPENFQEALDKMVAGKNTPLRSLMNAFTNERGDELSLFSQGEDERVGQTITLEDKRRFAANLLTGIVEGTEYMQQNEQALRTAVLNSHEDVQIGEESRKVEHFYNETELNEYTEQVRQLDTATLKQRMRALAQGAPQVRLDGLARGIEASNRRLPEIQERVEKLKGETLGSVRHKAEINRLREEEVVINEWLKQAHQEVNDIINREAISKVMSQQKPGGGEKVPEQVEVPLERRTSVRDSIQIHLQPDTPLNKLEQEAVDREMNIPQENLEREIPIEKNPTPEKVKDEPIGGLTEEEQRKLESLRAQVTQIEQGIEAIQSMPRKVEALSKLDTRGEKPDLSQFSDQELRDIFDLAGKSNDLNKIDEVLGHHHKFSSVNIFEARQTGDQLSREELEEFTHTILEVQNHNIPTRNLLTSQVLLMGSADRGFSGWSANVKMDFNALKQSVAEREGPDVFGNGDLEVRVNEARERVKLVATDHTEQAVEYIVKATKASLEAMAFNKLSAPQVALEIEEMTNRVGGGQELIKMDGRGANLTGVDVSASDLSGLELDAPTLSRATGIETATGLDENLRAQALKIKPYVTKLDKLAQEKARLENGATAGDKFTAFFKNGAKGVKGEIAKLEKEQRVLNLALEKTLGGVSVEQHRENLNQMKQEGSELLSRYNEARRNVTAKGLDTTFGGKDVTDEDFRSAVDKVNELKPAKKQMLSDIKMEEKALKVRDSVDKKQETSKKSQGKKQSV